MLPTAQSPIQESAFNPLSEALSESTDAMPLLPSTLELGKMLLYTRFARPKPPKRRSRAGCNYCKEKKKKCDESRPECGRCREHGQNCVYEPVKPRQRRRFQSVEGTPLGKIPSIPLTANQSYRLPRNETTFENWETLLLHFDNAHTYGDLAIGRYDREPAPLLKCVGGIADGVPKSWSPEAATSDCSPDPVDFGFLSLDNVSGPQEDVEEVVDHDSTFATPSSARTSLALVPPQPTASPYLEFRAPAFAEFSQHPNRRALVDHFTNVLSHLIVLREDDGNPFQQLVLPLSHKSPAVMNAIYALASAHLEYRGVQNSEKGVYFHSQAIQGLAQLIAKGYDVNSNEVLSTIILLIYYEVLVQTGRSNIVDGHLKGAMAIINSKDLTDPTGIFLERAFRFYDVIAALSLGTAPIYPAPSSGGFAPFPPINCHGATVPAGNADTLLGMATSLWPIIHRLSTLGGLKKALHMAESQSDHSRAAILRTEFYTAASAIELALEEWRAVLPGEAGEKATESRSILNTAMAYRHSGFVYLYRTAYGCPRSHTVVQRHAHISLTHCVGTVKNEGPMGALLWPLFVAACEAIDPSDRDLARQAFEGVARRQGMANIEQSWCIVQEVWRRADNGEDAVGEMGDGTADLWRRVSEDMGVTVVFG